MGGAAFILLKAGRNRLESAKQAERRLAGLWKILGIGGLGVLKPSPIVEKKYCDDGPDADFQRIWLICQYRGFCYLDHSFSSKIGAVSCGNTRENEESSIGGGFYT